jgi:Tfp pilus assembly protein PilP
MKARTIALLWVMASGMAMAQTTPPSQKVAPDSKPAAAKPAMKQAKPSAAPKKPAAVPTRPAAAPTKPAAAPTKAAAAPKKPAAAPMKSAAASPMARKAAMAPAKAKAKPAATKVKKEAPPATTAAAKASAGKRDPFISPIREQGATGPSCTTGKKCLAINSIVLRGIVKSQAGMIAVVESSVRRISYFLRENDPVFNGYVVKITGDTVVFRENVMDRLGKQSTRDVVMKVVAPVV